MIRGHRSTHYKEHQSAIAPPDSEVVHDPNHIPFPMQPLSRCPIHPSPAPSPSVSAGETLLDPHGGVAVVQTPRHLVEPCLRGCHPHRQMEDLHLERVHEYREGLGRRGLWIDRHPVQDLRRHVLVRLPRLRCGRDLFGDVRLVKRLLAC